MTTCNLKSAHPARTIEVDACAEGQTRGRVPYRISEGAHSIVLHFTEKEVSEHGPEMAAILDTALNCLIGRMKQSANTEQHDAPARQPFLVGSAAVADAAQQPAHSARKPGD